VERDKPKKSESVGQTLLQLPWKQKRGDLKNYWIPFIKLHETSTLKKDNFTWHMIFLQGFIKLDQGISEIWVGQTFEGRKKE
jgi:hypothetical protein